MGIPIREYFLTQFLGASDRWIFNRVSDRQHPCFRAFVIWNVAERDMLILILSEDLLRIFACFNWLNN